MRYCCYTYRMRKRAGALYIKDHKLYLICEDEQGFYWTPGGGLENDETYEQALKRELDEELNARLLSAELYMTIIDKTADETVRYFLVDIALPDTLPNGTTYYWYGRNDYETNTPQISQRIYQKVYPKLIADKLV